MLLFYREWKILGGLTSQMGVNAAKVDWSDGVTT